MPEDVKICSICNKATSEKYHWQKHHQKNEPNKGRFEKGLIPWNKGQPFMKGENNPMYGKPRSERVRKLISKGNKGLKRTDEERMKMSEVKKGKNHPLYGKHHTEKTKQKISEARRKQIFPRQYTEPELIFESICKKHDLPFKYTGDGKFWIENVNPDFIDCNGKKVAVDIFGDYWHDIIRRPNIKYSQTYNGRKEIFKKYGWKLIILWENELKNKSTEEILRRVI